MSLKKKENQAVESLSEISVVNYLRKKRDFFEKNRYSVIDFQEKTLKISKIKNKKIINKNIVVDKGNALFWELESFVNSIIKNKKIKVSGKEGLMALKIATQIHNIIEQQ